MKTKAKKYGVKYVYYYDRLESVVLITRIPPTPDGKWEGSFSIEHENGCIEYPVRFIPEVNHLYDRSSVGDYIYAWDQLVGKVPGMQFVGEL